MVQHIRRDEMNKIYGSEDDCENYTLSDEEIDKINMDEIDWYIEKTKEYNKKGFFTGFMDAKIYIEPSEPKLNNYSWE